MWSKAKISSKWVGDIFIFIQRILYIMTWRTIKRPGHFGKKRDEFHRQYDEKFGKDNWRIM